MAAVAEDMVWRTHSDYEPTSCLGSLVFTHTEGACWSVECDQCGVRAGILRTRIDADFRVRRLLDAAQLPERFAGAPMVRHPGIVAAMDAIEEFIGDRGRRPPMLIGSPGRGKTHLLCRAADRVIRQHETPVRYCTFADLLEAAKLAMDQPGASSTAIFDQAAHVELLVLDDLGAGLDPKSGWAMGALEQLVDRRYRGRPRAQHLRPLAIMGATNVPLTDWPARFGARAASRLMELCAPVTVDGEDWRLR
jgi:DNA replication protein DnaC